ncbi:espin-like protein [Procambarus clarkii]|uniref:espin-like protein n=1 Tax=Procambarus clarkii TaxID=6728 RepID=UPI0037422350
MDHTGATRRHTDSSSQKMDHTGATRRHTDSSSQEMDHTGATRRHTDSSSQEMDHTGATRRHTDSSSQEMDHTGATRRHKATQDLVAGVFRGDQVLVLAALALGADTSVTVVDRVHQESFCMLSVAAARGHTHLVPHLLAAGLPVEGSGESYLTPLHWAAGRGHDQVVRQLLSAQAHLQARGLDGETALHAAAQQGHESCVVTLLGAGADPDSRDDDGRSPLHYVALGNHTGVVQILLIAAGCDRHAVSKRGETALHEAARGGGLEATQCLVEAGLDPHARNIQGDTPLDMARLAGRDRVEWWLRKLPRPHPAAGTPTLPRPHPAVGTPTLPRPHPAARTPTLPHPHPAARTPTLPRPHPAAGTPTLPRPHPAAGTPTLPRPHPAAGTPTLPRPHPAAGTPTLPRPHPAAGTPTLPRPHPAAGTPTLPRPHPAAGTPTLLLVRQCWIQCEEEYAALLHWIMEGNTGLLAGSIPQVYDGHQQDHTGRTLLHWAAELGPARVVKVLLEVCRVYPHVLTWAGETPADLALRAGHPQVFTTLHSYHRSKVEGGPGEMYEQLLGVISLCDDTQQAGQLLWSGASLEPLGCWSVSPLCLAVTSNRCRITTLLLAAGAPLTTTSHGLNLLTLAWCSPDVTLRLQITITRVSVHHTPVGIVSTIHQLV